MREVDVGQLFVFRVAVALSFADKKNKRQDNRCAGFPNK